MAETVPEPVDAAFEHLQGLLTRATSCDSGALKDGDPCKREIAVHLRLVDVAVKFSTNNAMMGLFRSINF